jgi:peptidoglycan/LPS O-acetylase OafA/YrhL
VFLLWGGAVALALLADRMHPSTYRLIQYVPCFLPGVLAFALRGRATLSPAVLFLGVLLPVMVALPLLALAGAPRTPLLWAACLAVGVAIPMCRPFTQPLLARVAQVLAKYSYGVYLLHPLFIVVVFRALPGFPLPLQLLLFSVLLAAAAWSTYHLIEAPGIAAGGRLAQRLRAGFTRGSALRGAVNAGPRPPSP